MNVVISNIEQSSLAGLNIDIIKTINGLFDADEIISMFSNFFFERMILDLTALKDYKDTSNLQKISMSLPVEKIIILLPNDKECEASTYLTKIISMGIYNFTTNIEGVKYLLDHPNSYKDVAHIHQLDELVGDVNDKVLSGVRVIGIKNITDHAGATSLIWMIKKELELTHGLSAVAIEIDKRDFIYLNDKNMISTTKDQFPMELLKLRDINVILVDLNDSGCDEGCGDVLYLIEPTSIKLNKLMKRDRLIFEKLKGKKIVLNKSLLENSDIMDFEYESKSKVFYNLPPINEKKRNGLLNGLLSKLGIIHIEKSNNSLEKNKVLGLFKF
ncbi:MAG: hypothetical protein RR359_01335 [Bacilli bacterium]